MHRLSFLFFLIFLAAFLSAQVTTYNLSFDEVTNNGSTYTVDALLSFEDNMDLATSNLVLNFNAEALANPRYEDGSTELTTTPFPVYTLSVTQPGTNRVSINVVLNVQDFGDEIGQDPVRIARITFDVTDMTQTSNLVWVYDGEQATTGSVVFQDDPGAIATTLLNANTLTGLDSDLDRILPLDLLAFTGRTEYKNNVLSLSTANEEGFSHFEVLRSPAGAGARRPDSSPDGWEVIGSTPGEDAGAMEAEGGGAYRFTDQSPLPAAFYRLRMVDLDGSFALSDVVLLERAGAAGELLVFPNPSNGRITVELPATDDAVVPLRITDLTGQVVFRRLVTRRSEQRPDLPAGIYLLSADLASGRVTRRIVIQ